VLTLDIKQTDSYRKLERKIRESRAKALISYRIFRLANNLAGDVKPVGQGVSELRIHHGPGYRVYFKQRGNEVVILLCGGDKSTQQSDIDTAQCLEVEWEGLWATIFMTTIRRRR
jgi:putative addiction module killer protein